MALPQFRGLKPAFVLASVVAVVFGSGGCYKPDAGGPSEASDKVVIVCGHERDWCEAMASAFNKSHPGITALTQRLSSGEALARIETGKDNPEFDVWHAGPADTYVTAGEKGLLEPYTSPNASKIPAQYKAASGLWTGAYLGALGFCSNEKVLKEKGVAEPQTWADLLNPALKKSVGMAHPATSGTAYTALWTHVELNNGNQDAALEYFRKLALNLSRPLYRSGTGPIAPVGRGEIAVGVVFAANCVTAQEQGFPVKVTYPSDGDGFEIGGLALLKNSRNAENAKKYIDWALSKEAQEIGATLKYYQRPTNPDATVHEKAYPTTLKLVDYDVVEAGKEKPALNKKFEDIIKKDEAK